MVSVPEKSLPKEYDVISFFCLILTPDTGGSASIATPSSRKLKKKEWIEDYFLQLVAYSEAHNKLYDTNIKTGRVFICTQNNEFQTFEIDRYEHWTSEWYKKLEQYYKKIL